MVLLQGSHTLLRSVATGDSQSRVVGQINRDITLCPHLRCGRETEACIRRPLVPSTRSVAVTSSNEAEIIGWRSANVKASDEETCCCYSGEDRVVSFDT